ncbi:ferredoxin [Phytohabitans sp. ZYX-F-186]|uniref:Ferredoxin n=1 Tax=Phytohabitans maris TaxID=3071409 RepID=A0ABU0Z9M2_9ACTN|nr:ferredoxin [Phytohabitans sp. ZYX-F-186]MDQ7903730.1 ferredoxin [Phytohabitans sp. ZYX-F-186]
MRVDVDFDSCESNALCAAVAPDVFELDDADQLHLVQDSPPERTWPEVEEAARACPKRAITLTAD